MIIGVNDKILIGSIHIVPPPFPISCILFRILQRGNIPSIRTVPELQNTMYVPMSPDNRSHGICFLLLSIWNGPPFSHTEWVCPIMPDDLSGFCHFSITHHLSLNSAADVGFLPQDLIPDVPLCSPTDQTRTDKPRRPDHQAF